MGGRHVYCAICGVKTGQAFWHEEHEDEYGPLEHVFPGGLDLEWMDDVRIICENPEWKGPGGKVYFSGRADYDDLNSFVVQPGRDPQFPGHVEHMSVYDSDGFGENEEALALPFHVACLEVLAEALGMRGPDCPDLRDGTLPVSARLASRPEVDREVLYETLKTLSAGGYTSLNIRYAPKVKERVNLQYFDIQPGDEALLSIPTRIPLLDEFYANLPVLDDEKMMDETKHNISTSSNKKDPFARLAQELVLLVLGHLDVASINALRASSRSVAALPLTADFWRARVRDAMPWLYDFPWEENQKKKVDWARVYGRLLRGSEDGAAQIPGLVARRRAWGACEQIADLYRRYSAQRSGPLVNALLWSVEGKNRPRITAPLERDVRMETLALVLELADINDPHIENAMAVHWTAEDAPRLAGLTVKREGQLNALGSPSGSVEEVRLPHEDWITGMMVFTREGAEERRDIVGLRLFFEKQDPVDTGACGRVGDLMRVIVKGSYNGVVGIRAEVSCASGLPLRLWLVEQSKQRIDGYQ